MKIVSVGLVRWQEDTPEPIVLAHAHNLADFGFFQRSSVGQMLTFFSRTLLKRTAYGSRQTISHEGYLCHCYMRSDGLGGVVISDEEYPARVAFSLVSKVQQEFLEKYSRDEWAKATEDNKFPLDSLPEHLSKYQDPTKADAVSKISKDLDDTTAILHKTIDAVLERGEKLEGLVDMSDDLTKQSKMFYKEAKKTNSCCKMM